MNAQSILRLALIGTVIAVFTHTRADPDLWGHVRFGHDIAVQHRIPDVDPYSVTIAGGRTRAAWLVPPLMILWTNVHGGWILGVGVLVLWIAGGLVAGVRRTETIALLAAGAVAIPATLINPYGWRLWTFLHETVGFGRADITDWQPVYRLGAFFVVLWVSL